MTTRCVICPSRIFFLKILPKENHLAEVVALYNRINSAGKRVYGELIY